jgi:hypothetical protein
MEALVERLGPDMKLESAPMKMGSRIMVSAILTLGAAGITAFFFWGALEVASGRAGPTGSIRTRSIISLLDLLGPIGVGVIGGILILVAILISIRLFRKPPAVTELTRK